MPNELALPALRSGRLAALGATTNFGDTTQFIAPSLTAHRVTLYRIVFWGTIPSVLFSSQSNEPMYGSRASVFEHDLDGFEEWRGRTRRQEQPLEQVSIESEERDRRCDLIADLFATRLEPGVALLRQSLAFL